MISLRNTSFFDAKGKRIRSYFEKPIYLSPLETVKIIIDELDTSGGTGAIFIFNWSIPSKSSEPIFESVMSSNIGQQGLSFTAIGKKIH